MKKRVFALTLVLVLAVSLFAACGKKSGPVTTDEAQKIALEALDLSQTDVKDVHTHIVDQNGIPCYSIHITTAAEEFSVVINAGTGEVLSGAN